jgi:hypothetical protein
MKLVSKYFAVGFSAALLLILSSSAPAITLVQDGQPKAVIVIPAGHKSPEAADLQAYLEKASGARLAIVPENKLGEAPKMASRLFVGPCRAAARVVNLKKLQPEGFAIKTDGDDLFIVGRDTTDTGLEVEGTFYGVCEFLERYVGVRWILPGPFGEVVPKQATIRVASVDIRQEPLLWQRKIRDDRTRGHRDIVERQLKEWGVPLSEWESTFSEANMRPWFRHQRLGRRVDFEFGHSFGGWWDKYHVKYPDIFAMQPNGTRINSNTRERLCVSNPVLWDLVAQDRIEQLRASPNLSGVSICPNDGGGGNKFCCCERCRALDSPEAQEMYKKNPKVEQGPGGEGPFPPLSDRYFRFFNEVAKRVKAAMPDRYVDCYAYSVYHVPPTIEIEDNVVVGYVGPNTYANDQLRNKARQDVLAFGKKAKHIMLRPNLLANPLGLPIIYVHKLSEDMRLFADHGLRLTDFASCLGNWGTQGLDYYVLAKLLWDPYADVDSIINDYCRAAYGPGAEAVKDYYRRTETLTDKIAATSPDYNTDNTLTDQFTDAALADLQTPLDKAIAAIGSSDPAAVQRVCLLTTGLQYARQTRRLLRAAADVREGKSSAEQFEKVKAEVLAFYKPLALSWAVATDQDYRKMRKDALRLKAGPRKTAADTDESP